VPGESGEEPAPEETAAFNIGDYEVKIAEDTKIMVTSPWGGMPVTLKAGSVVPISILKDDLSEPEAISLTYQGIKTFITQEELQKLGTLTRREK
jgi:hypothetical protein